MHQHSTYDDQSHAYIQNSQTSFGTSGLYSYSTNPSDSLSSTLSTNTNPSYNDQHYKQLSKSLPPPMNPYNNYINKKTDNNNHILTLSSSTLSASTLPPLNPSFHSNHSSNANIDIGVDFFGNTDDNKNQNNNNNHIRKATPMPSSPVPTNSNSNLNPNNHVRKATPMPSSPAPITSDNNSNKLTLTRLPTPKPTIKNIKKGDFGKIDDNDAKDKTYNLSQKAYNWKYTAPVNNLNTAFKQNKHFAKYAKFKPFKPVKPLKPLKPIRTMHPFKQKSRDSIELSPTLTATIKTLTPTPKIPFPSSSEIKPLNSLIDLYDWDRRGKIGEGSESKVFMIIKKGNNDDVYACKVSYYYVSGYTKKKEIIIKENKLLHLYGGILTYEIYHEYNQVSGQGAYYFIQDLIDVSLKDIIYLNNSSLKCLTYSDREAICKSYIYQLLKMLSDIHRCGLIHGDLKCENILIKKHILGGGVSIKDSVKIIDFGLTKKCKLNGNDLYISSGNFFGTLGYAPPELYKYKQDRFYNHNIDLWAIGIITSEIILRDNIIYFNNLNENAVYLKNQNKYRNKSLFDIKMRIYWGNIKKLNIKKEIIKQLKWDKDNIGQPGVSKDCINFVSLCLQNNYKSRITAKKALKHQWFKEYH